MGLTLTSENKNTGIEPDVYSAICYAIYDLATQEPSSDKFKPAHKVALLFELPDLRINIDGKDLPKGMSLIATASLHEKANLRKMLASWRGKDFTEDELKGFELRNVLGKPCRLNIVHNAKGKAVVDSILRAAKGQPDKAENPLVYCDWQANDEIPAHAPEWVVRMIHASQEWRALEQSSAMLNEVHEVDDDKADDLPF